MFQTTPCVSGSNTWSRTVMYATFHQVSAPLRLARYDCSKRKSGMGGKDFRRGVGLRFTMSEGMVEEEADERVGEIMVAGTLTEAAVEGLRSWVGEGSRLIETD